MKKIIKFITYTLIVLLIGYGIINDINRVNKLKVNNVDMTGAKGNGWLKVKGTKLLNEHNKEIQLKGISTHGIQWFDLYTYENIKNLKDTWGINVFRIAMYTDPESNGYIKDKELKNKLIKLVDYCIDLDLYVIIDWHILNDNNPNMYKDEAKIFFDEMSKMYKNNNNVIYEICNEPNGDVTWEKDIKVYAEDIIKVIRKNSKKSLIIVGTPDWSKDIESVVKSPLKEKNIMYAIHFYAGSNDKSLRDSIDKSNLPIFISECGITDISGNGEIYKDKFSEWVNYLNNKNISWIVWALSNKNESSSLLNENYEVVESYIEVGEHGSLHKVKGNDINDYLSETGKYIKEVIKD